MKLSVAILTHNEEKNIVACLKSVYDWVDEIVVVDGESTDKTVDLIKKFDPSARFTRSGQVWREGKIIIYLENNPPNFLINKQKSIERCTKDWILQLDADEVVTTELKDEILSVVSNQQSVVSGKKTDDRQLITDNCVAYWIPRLTFFLGSPLKKGGQYPDYVLRLFKRGAARLPLETIHDQFKVTEKSKVGYLENPLLHHSYPTFDTYLRKWVQYSLFEGEALYNKGVRPSLKNHLLYLIIYPKFWFLKTYFRHKGFMDGYAGFIFSLFSAMRYWVSYVKLVDLYHQKPTRPSS